MYHVILCLVIPCEIIFISRHTSRGFPYRDSSDVATIVGVLSRVLMWANARDTLCVGSNACLSARITACEQNSFFGVVACVVFRSFTVERASVFGSICSGRSL
jgi:hypothetical protein